jgi:hypothetical protein
MKRMALQQFQMESCQPIKRLKGNKKKKVGRSKVTYSNE